MLKIGDKVKLYDCAEAHTYPDIIFTVVSDVWELGHGRKVVRITSPEKDFRGGFAVDKLRLEEYNICDDCNPEKMPLCNKCYGV